MGMLQSPQALTRNVYLGRFIAEGGFGEFRSRKENNHGGI